MRNCTYIMRNGTLKGNDVTLSLLTYKYNGCLLKCTITNYVSGRLCSYTPGPSNVVKCVVHFRSSK